MDELEHALASVALELGYESEDAANESPAIRAPFLPPELIYEIIYLAIGSLIRQERELPSQALLTNKFLLSAALVDRTWNAIATSALLLNGIVQPGGVKGFLDHLEKHGGADLDHVRFGAGPTALLRDDSDPSNDSADDASFQLLISSLPNLKRLEIFGTGLRLKKSLPCPHTWIWHLTISSTSFEQVIVVSQVLQLKTPPKYLSIINTQKSAMARQVHAPLTTAFFGDTRNIRIFTNQLNSWKYLEIILLLPMQLKSIRLEYNDTERGEHFCASQVALHRSHGGSGANISADGFDLPELSHLATHLSPLLLFAVQTGERPALTFLEVLPEAQPEKEESDLSEYIQKLRYEQAEFDLVNLVHTLPVLRTLKVPSCWRSDAVEDACEAKGVDLRWT